MELEELNISSSNHTLITAKCDLPIKRKGIQRAYRCSKCQFTTPLRSRFIKHLNRMYDCNTIIDEDAFRNEIQKQFEQKMFKIFNKIDDLVDDGNRNELEGNKLSIKIQGLYKELLLTTNTNGNFDVDLKLCRQMIRKVLLYLNPNDEVNIDENGCLINGE
jgi:hypothetical protein